jgi:hypothetical protein
VHGMLNTKAKRNGHETPVTRQATEPGGKEGHESTMQRGILLLGNGDIGGTFRWVTTVNVFLFSYSVVSINFQMDLFPRERVSISISPGYFCRKQCDSLSPGKATFSKRDM